jgi:hypothetical protein
MTIGVGKYNHLCTYVRKQANADGALVIIIGGKLGSGFSIQAPLVLQLQLPDVLESMAKQIRADFHEEVARATE